MKAIVCTRQGPPEVLELREIDKPEPHADEVLIKVHASSVTRGDVFFRKVPRILFLLFRLFGFRRKRIPGHELAGVVEGIGADVTRFKRGNRVFGTSTGLATGGNAEYICLPERWRMGVVATMPADTSFEEAAVVPVGAMTALHLLKKADVQPGQKVLVYGASGSVGTYAVQLAKASAAEVTGVCSTANLETVTSIGADKVVDYTQEDFTANGETYDVIFDAVGKIRRKQCKGSLAAGGTYLTVKSATTEKTEYLLALRELIEAGKLKPVIDRTYPLEQTAEAHTYVEAGHKKGNVVVRIDPA